MLRMLQKSLSRTSLPTGCVNILAKCPAPISQVRWYNKPADNIEKWINSLDEAQQKRVRFIQNELALHGVEENPVPKVEALSQWDYEHILTLSQNQRQKYYTYLFKMNNSDAMDYMKRAIRQQIKGDKERLSIKNVDVSDEKIKHLEYGLGKNCYLPKIYGRTIDKWRNKRTMWRVNVLGAPKLIFDCSFSHEMTFRENLEAAKQLTLIFGINRSHLQPFDLQFCGMNPNSLLWKHLHKCNPLFGHKPLPVKIREEQTHELYPKENLVMLTPDSPNILHEYNPHDHYVISGLVDRGDKVPVTLAKAKQLDIRTARLPLEQYRNCRINKTLTLDQMLCVMLEIKSSRDWNKAFNYVARRKFY